jgi:hypothetical protein
MCSQGIYLKINNKIYIYKIVRVGAGAQVTLHRRTGGVGVGAQV